jgi:hypothetical protein
LNMFCNETQEMDQNTEEKVRTVTVVNARLPAADSC